MKTIIELKERIANDADFVNSMKDATSAEDLLKKLTAEGYSVTESELGELCSSVASGEISDDELDNVNGGMLLSMKLPLQFVNWLSALFGRKSDESTSANFGLRNDSGIQTLEYNSTDNVKIENLPTSGSSEPHIKML